MKLNGQKVEGPNVEVIVIPRSDRNLVFKAQAVLDYEDFDKLCPIPTPPPILKPGGVKSFNPEDPKYKEALDDWATKKTNWLVLKSLSATETLEWDKVNLSDPDTWDKYQEEFKESGLTPPEVSQILSKVWKVNGLNNELIEQATKSFLAIQAQEQKE